MAYTAEGKPLHSAERLKSMFSIADISTYLPDTQFSVLDGVDLLRKQGISITPEQIHTFQADYGFKHAPIELELTLEEMIYKACDPLLERNEIPLQTILLFNGNEWSLQYNLFRALSRKYHLKQTDIYSIGKQTCASFHMALQLAKDILNVSPDKGAILLVSADKAPLPSLKLSEIFLSGDNASACLLTPYGGMHQTYEIYNIDGFMYDDRNIEGITLFNMTFYITMRNAIQFVLKKSQIPLAEIKLIIGSNVSLKTWELVASLLHIPVSKFYVRTSEVGHLFCSDIQYNIQQSIADGALEPGDLYLTINAGYGGFMGCALHRY